VDQKLADTSCGGGCGGKGQEQALVQKSKTKQDGPRETLRPSRTWSTWTSRSPCLSERRRGEKPEPSRQALIKAAPRGAQGPRGGLAAGGRPGFHFPSRFCFGLESGTSRARWLKRHSTSASLPTRLASSSVQTRQARRASKLSSFCFGHYAARTMALLGPEPRASPRSTL